MKIEQHDIDILKARFPKFKLFYNKIINKKVYSNYYIIVPIGIKAYVWFTYYGSNNVCIIMELDYKNNIKKMYTSYCCFDDELSYGTILYGTISINKNKSFFICENIIYYKGDYVQNNKFNDKLKLYDSLFNKETKNMIGFNTITMFITKIYLDYQTAMLNIPYLPYKVYGITFQNAMESYSFGLMKYNNIEREAIFKVKADIKQDIYKLYCYDNGNTNIYHDIAFINDYKTSVYMNNIFRTIKENKNLDLLEESDEEEEFENVSEDKYVNLSLQIKMKCIFNNKFKKWKPIEIVPNNTKLITKRELK